MSSEHVLQKITDEINRIVPKNVEITMIEFEGPEVAIYSKNPGTLVDSEGLISQIARTIRKRVVIRSDPSIRLKPEIVEEKIKEIIGDVSQIGEINFDDTMGEVIVHVDRLGKLMGKDTNYTNEIISKTFWRPKFYRIPPIPSNVIRSIRNVLSTDAAERRAALIKIGKIVHRETLLEQPIIRITALGGYQEVGRSSTLLQTGDANILIDCGVSVGSSSASNMLPRFDLPEFEIQDLDAVVISHSHLDHCLPGNTPVLMANGTWKYINQIQRGDRITTINWETGQYEHGRVEQQTITSGHESVREIFTTHVNLKASPNHRFLVVDNLEIVEVEASKLERNYLLPIYVPPATNRPKLDKINLNIEISYNGRIPISEKMKTEFKSLRFKLGYTLSELAKKIGIKTQTLQKIENDQKNVYLETLLKVLDYHKIQYQDYALENNLLRVPRNLSPKLAQLVGYIQGDGTRSGEYSIRITEADKNVISTYNNILSELFGYSPIIRKRNDTILDTYYIEINNSLIVRFLEKNFETVLGLRLNIKVPPIIELTDKQVVCGYLKGLFDAEGSAIPSVKFKSYSQDLIKNVQNLLFRMQIHCAYSEKDHSIYINSIIDKKVFQKEIGFSSSVKSNMVGKNIQEGYMTDPRLRDLIPITSQDFNRILEKIGYVGRARQGPTINKLPMGLLDFHRKKSGYGTRPTIHKLISFLSERHDELSSILNYGDITDFRRVLSITRSNLSESTGLSMMQIQYREEGYSDKLSGFLENFLIDKIVETLNFIEETIEKIEKILLMNVKWHRIKKIKDLENSEPLFDIRVTPNPNFVANSIIVHNCGFVPFLFKYGYEGPVYTTHPTRDLMTMLQIDYLDIAVKEGKLLPYSKADIRKTTLHTIPIGYGEVTDIAPGVKLTFHNAGHILGSAIVHLHIGNGKYNIAFAHDFKFSNSRLLDRAVHKFPRLETMIMEATYGNPEDMTPSRQQCEKQLADIINETLHRDGKVLIPVLAVGRAQELQLVIENLMKNERIPTVPVYVDGMIKEATAVTTSHPEYLSKQTRDRIFIADDNPFLSSCFQPVTDPETREKIIQGGPCIIMATSGMLVGGPSVRYFNELAENRLNSLVFVSYQGKGTLGRKIDEGAKQVTMKVDNGKTIALDVNIKVYRISGFTGHSDRGELMEYAKRLSPRPKQFILVHGEASKCITLAKSIGRTVKREAFAPPIGTTTRLIY